MYRPCPERGESALSRWGAILVFHCLAMLLGAIITPVSIAAPSAAPERAYEMVTPAEKPTRRGGFPATEDRASGDIPLISPDGNHVLSTLAYGVLSDAALSWPYDYAISTRFPDGWETHSIYDTEIHGGVQAGSLANVSAVAPNLSALTLNTTTAMATTDNPLGAPPAFMNSYPYTRFSDGRDFQLWLTDPAQRIGNDDQAKFSADSSTMVRSGLFRGLLGPSDPSLQQLAGSGGGWSVYGMDVSTGSRYLVSECSGEGATATLIPERLADGKLSAQTCEEGSPLHPRGAATGGYASTFGTSAASSLYSTRDRAVADHGKTVAMTTPQVANQPSSGTQGCTTATGAATLCQPQIYISRISPQGKRFVRWISRPAITGQDAALLGRGAAYEAMSGDGSRILFRTNAPLTADDPNGEAAPTPGGIKTGTASRDSWDLYAYDLPDDPEADPADGQLTRITAGPNSEADPNTNCTGATGSGLAQRCNANAGGGVVRYMSDDGSRIYFVTSSEIPGAVNSPPSGSAAGNVPQSGSPNPYVNTTSRNLYLWDESEPPSTRWRFIASLPAIVSGTNLEGCASLYSTADQPIYAAGGAGDQASVLTAIKVNCVKGSPDGNHLLLFTNARLTSDDEDDAFDLFAYDRSTDALTRITAPGPEDLPYVCVDSGPVLCNGTLGWRQITDHEQIRYSNLTEDGAVIFETRLRLLPEKDTNGDRMDVYVWHDGELSLISPGNSDDDAYFAANTLDGKSVFFTTSQPIDRWREIDPGDYDVYVARIGGGFSLPEAPRLCDFDAGGCAGSASSTPGAPGSATGAQRSGNVQPVARDCRAQRLRFEQAKHKLSKLRKAAKRQPAARRLRAKARKQGRKVSRQRQATKRCMKRKGN